MSTEPVQVDQVHVYAGSKLREHLERAGLTPEAFAPLVGITGQSVRNYLRGHAPSGALLATFAAKLTEVIRQSDPDFKGLTPDSFFIVHPINPRPEP